MGKETISFDHFLCSVAPQDREGITEIHEALMTDGCVADIQEKRSGLFVSYTREKKSIVNFLFRKKGLIVRIYGGHVNQYMDFIDTLPDGMVASIKKASVCKRLLDPTTCNQKCSMGYDFILKGEHMQKCKNNCFLFDVSDESKPYIKELIQLELLQRTA